MMKLSFNVILSTIYHSKVVTTTNLIPWFTWRFILLFTKSFTKQMADGDQIITFPTQKRLKNESWRSAHQFLFHPLSFLLLLAKWKIGTSSKKIYFHFLCFVIFYHNTSIKNISSSSKKILFDLLLSSNTYKETHIYLKLMFQLNSK